MSFPSADCIVMCDIALCTACEWDWEGFEFRLDVAGLLACPKRRVVRVA
jgi:hypothetical protein